VCDYSFYSRTDLERHLNLEIKYFKCDHCDKAFGRKDKLKDHINATHKKIKRYCTGLICDNCDFSTASKKPPKKPKKSKKSTASTTSTASAAPWPLWY
jgi:hypothetical protein